MTSCGIAALDELLSGGYPSKSAILVEGSSGNERDALGYLFIQAGLGRGDYCAYVTRLPPSDVVSDARAFEVDFGSVGPRWMSPEEGERSYMPNDLATISFGIKEILKGRGDSPMRVVFDGLSQLLMLHSADSVYRFLSQLLPEIKKGDAVVLATVQGDMHQPQVISALELIFDGVIEVRHNDQGELSASVKKMRGLNLSARSTPLRLTSRTPVSSSGAKKRLAVLPFVNISPDPNDEYVSDGLTEELITTLSRIEGLEVIARTSVMRYRNSQKSIAEVCGELGVGTILQGSTRKAGNKLRVGVQMIDAEREGHLWSESYDRELTDIFAIQAEISEKVAGHVKLRLDAAGASAPQLPQMRNPVAYDYYLRGRHRLNIGPKGMEEALRLFKLAIEKDPSLARAYTGLADYYSYAADDTMESSEAYPMAKEYARMALNLDPNLSDAHASLGLIAFLYDWDWPGAEKHFLESLRLNPNNAFGHLWYGLFLKSRGRFDKALASLATAKDLDPFSDSIRFATAAVYACKQMDELASAECREALGLNGDNAAAHVMLGILALKHGDKGMALSYAKKGLVAQGDKGAKGLNGYLFGKLGEEDEARKILDEVTRVGIPDPFAIAQIMLGLGDKQAALREMRRAVESHSSYVAIFNRNNYLDELRSEPEYLKLLADANLE